MFSVSDYVHYCMQNVEEKNKLKLKLKLIIVILNTHSKWG